MKNCNFVPVFVGVCIFLLTVRITKTDAPKTTAPPPAPAPTTTVVLQCGANETSCNIVIGSNLTITVRQTQAKAQNISYDFLYYVDETILKEPKKDGKLMFTPLASVSLSGNESKTLELVTGKGDNTAGEIRIGLNSSEIQIDLKKVSITVEITRSTGLKIFIAVIGWIYFVAWSVSFYPQCWLNFKRKSVIGLNFDFIALNLTGFTCYTIFNCGLYFNANIRRLYFKVHPLGVVQVELNDVVFALHAVIITSITILQIAIYDRGRQTVSRVCRALLSAMLLFAAVTLILGGTNIITWLDWINYLSYIKLFITIIKYIPQAVMNFKRKSTDGWSIGNILLDFTGGSLSIMQMFLKAYNYDDWLSIFGNITKFGLGFFSVLFDILFILQHYVFYRHQVTPYEEIINGGNSPPSI